ncbi:hypothetical protein JNW89_34110, partial [Micromonospora sp. 4G55]|nr:hypothetical protein [Micromonospora sp. 4G55]
MVIWTGIETGMDNSYLPRRARHLSCALLTGVGTLLAFAGAAPASDRTAAAPAS